jgi:hypothetical protein
MDLSFTSYRHVDLIFNYVCIYTYIYLILNLLIDPL